VNRECICNFYHLFWLLLLQFYTEAILSSVPEGDDKPLKYPLMFSKCHVLLVNKTDYLPLSDFNMALMEDRVKKLNPEIEIFKVSCKTGEGIDLWAKWLKKTVLMAS